jgi:hypothetical protein
MALGTTSAATNGLLIGGIGLVLVIPVTLRIAARRFDPFEPIVLFALAYGIMFVVRPAAMLVTDSLAHDGPRQTLDISGTFTEMLVVALVGGVAFVFGYALPAGERLARAHRGPRPRLDVGRLVVAALLTALAALLAFGIFLATSDGLETLRTIVQGGAGSELGEAMSASMYLWFAFFLLVPATLVLLAIAFERRHIPLIAVSVCLAALFLARSVPLGSRIALLPFLGGLFVLVYLRRSARPSGWTLVALAVVALVASTFLSDLRGRDTRGETVAETAVRAATPSRVADSVLTGPDSEMAPTLAAALAVIPEKLPHTYGRTVFGDLLVRPVPRPLWEDKPLIPRHRLVATVWPVEYANGTMNPEFSALLYFYWDLGVVGVFLGLAAYGIIARYLYAYFLRNHEHLYVQVLFSISLWFLVIGLRDSPVDTLVWAAFMVAPIWMIFRIARRPAASGVEQAGARHARSAS